MSSKNAIREFKRILLPKAHNSDESLSYLHDECHRKMLDATDLATMLVDF